MHKFMEIVGYILAIIGLACVVKHIMHGKEGCVLCGWQKTKVEDEKKTGSRYGSNPIHY
jgi:hypothetical protein